MLGPRQHLQAVSVGRHSVVDRIRDPSLTGLLILEVSIIFLTAPLVAKGLPIADMMVDILTWAMVVIIVLLSERWGAIISIVLAIGIMSATLWMGADLLPISPVALSHGGSILGFSALTWVVAHAVFAPGRITAQRVQGAVIVYLNLAIFFSSDYRVVGEINPTSFNIAVGHGYFSTIVDMMCY